MNIQEMLAQADTLFKGAAAIIGNPQASAEDQARVNPMLVDARKYKADALNLMEIEKEGAALVTLMSGESGGSRQKQTATDEFKDWGEFLQAAHTAKSGGKVDSRLKYFTEEAGQSQKDMSGASGESGGFLIDKPFLARLMAVSAEQALVRPRANVIPMTSRSLTIPALKQTAALGAGMPPWFGGLQAYWIGEGEAKPASDADFRDITLVAKKLAMFTRASDELLADGAISLDAFLSGPQGMAGAIAWKEDYAYLRGNGVAQPLGILNSPATLSIRRDVSGKVRYDDLVRMVAQFYGATGLWAFSRSVYAELLRMEDTEGHLIWATGQEGGALTLLGMPYKITEKMSRVGVTGDIGLFDFSAYLIGDRQATTVESTKFEAWQYDKTSWRAIHRVDGQPWLDAPLTLDDQVTQVSPFVILSSDVS